MTDLSALGILFYFIYPVLLISVAVYSLVSREINSESFFFSNRDTHWFLVGISFYSSTIISPYLFGFTSKSYLSILPFVFGLISIVMLIILGRFIGPVLLKLNVQTLPEFFEIRFGILSRYLVSAIYIVTNIFVRLLILLIVGNIFISAVSGIDAYFSLVFFITVAGLYLIIGGLRAEIYVSTIHVLFIAIVAVAFFVWLIGNSGSSQINALNIGNSVASKFSIPEILIGLPIIGFWLWCSDEFVVQKVISSGNIGAIRKASILSAILQVLPYLIAVLPGMVIASVSPDFSGNILKSLANGGPLPTSLKGGLIIAFAAVLMSALASLFNSTTTIFTFNFYRGIRSAASDRKLVLIGRLTTIILLLSSILLIPLIQSLRMDFCFKLFNVFCYFTSMISAVFLIGLTKKEIKDSSVSFALLFITLIIVLKAVTEIFFDNHTFDIFILNGILHSEYLEFSTIIFVLSLFSILIINKIKLYHKLAGTSKRVIKILIEKSRYKKGLTQNRL